MATEQQITRFLQISSFRGLLALYACLQSRSTKRPFIMKDLFAQSEDYVNGFLVACTAFDLIEIATHRTVTMVERIDMTMADKLHDVIYERAKSYDRENGYPSPHEFSWVRKVMEIESYFTAGANPTLPAPASL